MAQEQVSGLIQASGVTQASDIVTIVKDAANILFFLVVGTVTVMTYRKAKETLLQPLRTEIFKEQLKLLSEISVALSAEVDEVLKIKQAIEVNSVVLFRDYGRIVLETKNDSFEQSPLPIGFGTTVIFYRAQTTNLTWEDYSIKQLYFDAEYEKWNETINKWINSPLVPVEIRNLLVALSDSIVLYPKELKQGLEVSKVEIQNKYPTPKAFQAATVEEIAKIVGWNHSYFDISSRASEVVVAIRSYYKPDNLLENKSKPTTLLHPKSSFLIRPKVFRYKFKKRQTN